MDEDKVESFSFGANGFITLPIGRLEHAKVGFQALFRSFTAWQGTAFSLIPPRGSLLELEFGAAQINMASRAERKGLDHTHKGSASSLSGKQ